MWSFEEMFGMTGTQIFDIMVANPQHEEVSTDVADEYDPSRPEFIARASSVEVARANAMLLGRQITKLESHAARRRSASRGKVVGHYESVLSKLTSEARQGRRVSFVVEETPTVFENAVALDEEVAALGQKWL